MEHDLATSEATKMSQSTCRYFQRGNCRRGRLCSFAHNKAAIKNRTDGYATITPPSITLRNRWQIHRPSGLSDEGWSRFEATSKTETHRIMSSNFVVTFDSGMNITKVSPVEATSNMVILDQLPQNIPDEKVWAQLLPCQSDLSTEAVQIKRTGGYASVIVRFRDLLTADLALRALRTKYRSSTFKSLPSAAGTSYSTAIHCSWPAACKTAYLSFKTEEAATEALSGDHVIRWWLMKCHPAEKRRGKYVVQVDGIHPDVTEKELISAFQCEKACMRKPTYTFPLDVIITRIRELFGKGGQADTAGFRVWSSPDARFHTAIVHMESTEAARRKVKELREKKQAFLGGNCLNLHLTYSVKVEVVSGIYRALSEDIKNFIVLNTADSQDTPRFKVLSDPSKSHRPAQIIIYGRNKSKVARAKAALRKLLEGEILCDDDGHALWNHQFVLHETIKSFSQALSNQGMGVHPYVDTRNRRITLYGPPEKCAHASVILKAELEKLLETSLHEFPMTRQMIDQAIAKKFQPLRYKIRKLGATSYFGNERILVTCHPRDLEKIRLLICDYLPDSQWELWDIKSELCPICFCPAENPKKTLCGHTYCASCLQDLIVHSFDSMHNVYNGTSVRCVGRHRSRELCNEAMPILFLRDAVTAAQADELFERAFVAYIKKNPGKYSYCPTPDCTSVYTITSEPGTIFSCPECFLEICTKCRINHDGRTCTEMEVLRREQEWETNRWRARAGVKPCPRCQTDIQKNGGCNHVICGACQSHICWMCLKICATGNAVYDHMERECPMRHTEEPIRVMVQEGFRWVVQGAEAVRQELEAERDGFELDPEDWGDMIVDIGRAVRREIEVARGDMELGLDDRAAAWGDMPPDVDGW